MQRTLVILKPDAYARGLLGELTHAFEVRGLMLVACKLTYLDDDLLTEHYSHLVGKDFYPRIADFMKRLPVLIQCWEGKEAVSVVRELVGPTNGRTAPSGTLRGSLSLSIQCNLVHASDSEDAAQVEIDRFFTSNDVLHVEHPLHEFLYAKGE